MEYNLKDKKLFKVPVFCKWLSGFVFMVIVLTFFSKTIYNHNLPTATLTLAKQGVLSHDISGSSSVSYKDIWDIYPTENGRIREIFIENGDEITEEQVLMTITLDSGEEKKILAPHSGIVMSVGIKEGMYIMGSQNTILLQIAANTSEWNTEIEITEEQAGQIKIEDPVMLKVDGSSENITGKIQAILSYVNAAGQNGYTASIIFESTQDIVGKPVAVTIPRESKNFDTIIPSYALHKDAAGYYVLSVQKKSGILGEEYIVVRNSVDLLDTDTTSSAIVGIDLDTPIIVAGTEEITEGMRVHYEESGE